MKAKGGVFQRKWSGLFSKQKKGVWKGLLGELSWKKTLCFFFFKLNQAGLGQVPVSESIEALVHWVTRAALVACPRQSHSSLRSFWFL